jgi:hypothetical protein
VLSWSTQCRTWRNGAASAARRQPPRLRPTAWQAAARTQRRRNAAPTRSPLPPPCHHHTIATQAHPPTKATLHSAPIHQPCTHAPPPASLTHTHTYAHTHTHTYTHTHHEQAVVVVSDAPSVLDGGDHVPHRGPVGLLRALGVHVSNVVLRAGGGGGAVTVVQWDGWWVEWQGWVKGGVGWWWGGRGGGTRIAALQRGGHDALPAAWRFPAHF